MDTGGRDHPPPRDGRDGCDNRGGRGFQPRPFTPGGHNRGSRPQTILAGVSSALIAMDASGIQASSVTPVVGPATLLPNVTCSPPPSSSKNTRRRPLPT